MNGYLANLFLSMRRYQRWIGFVAVIVLAAGWGSLSLRAQRRRQPAHAKQNYKTVFNRATAICTALGETCEMDPQPIFSVHKDRCYVNDNTPLRLWKFNCYVDGRPTWLVFNDDTAGLCYLVAEPKSSSAPDKAGRVALDSSSTAAEAGFQRLKEMGLLGHGMSAALRAAPQMNRMSDTWQMTWWVKANANAAPYSVRMELERSKGVPLGVLDTGNLVDPTRF